MAARFCRFLLLAVFIGGLNASSNRPAVNQELSNTFNELWGLDVNRMNPGLDYTISVQGRAGFVSQGSLVVQDHASLPLFSNVNEAKLENRTTFSRLMKLLDNYERSTGITERVTSEEQTEISLFLDAVLETQVMKPQLKTAETRPVMMFEEREKEQNRQLKHLCAAVECCVGLSGLPKEDHWKNRAHQYLVSKGKSRSDLRLFKNQLNLIWFHLYHRQRNTGPDSCGFEHVFVGETRSGTEIIGFHNWVQFYLQEKNSQLDYKGYKAREHDLPDHDDHVLNLQFSWHGVLKPVGSAFIGTSPEFEMAIFTIIFLMNTDRSTTVLVNIDQCQLELVVVRQGRCLGTAYPKLLSSNSRHVREHAR